MIAQSKLAGLKRVCGNIPGGVSKAWVFDGAAFDFTQDAAAPLDGAGSFEAPGAYSAIAVATGAVPANARLYRLEFEKKTAEYTYTQSRKGCASKYEHQFAFNFNGITHAVTGWQMAMDAAACCGALGLILQLNSGKIIVLGEKLVGGTEIDVNLELVQDGSTGGSGKLIDDENTNTIVFKGDHTRGAFEYKGTVATLIALETAGA